MARSNEDKNADEKREQAETEEHVETRGLDALVIPGVRLRRLQEGVGAANSAEGAEDKED